MTLEVLCDSSNADTALMQAILDCMQNKNAVIGWNMGIALKGRNIRNLITQFIMFS